jgi:YidC/Oxa1 family membrane protein insertase
VAYLAWAALGTAIWGTRKPAKPQPEPPVVKLPMRQLWSLLPAAIEGQAGDGGLGGACRLAAATAIADWSAEGPQAFAKRAPEPVPVPAKAVQQIEVVRAEPHREVVIGDDSKDSPFNVKVVLTSKGAAVQSLVLNKFNQANRLGRPDGDPPPPLHLIPNNPKEPSNVLYHYAPSEDTRPEHPLDTLGKLEWMVQSQKNGPNSPVHEVSFTALVPKLDVLVTKTYTLRPGTYHVELSLRFERSQKSDKPISFRYQLTGAHGLPIEGEWYTTTYRNALIGTVDPSHHVWRDLQQAQAIGAQEGGHEILKTEERWVRYAAVANQFFASAVVVDDHQEPGVSEKFLAWARPTLESEPDPRKRFLDDINVRVVSEAIELKPGVPVVHKYVLYNGPVKVRLLGHLEGAMKVDPNLVNYYENENQLGLNTLTDSGNFGQWTQLLISCTNLMHGLLWYLHKYVMPWSYGLCIILLTVIVRGIMFPFSRKQAVASAKMQAKMAELAPEVKKLEEKYKNDAMELQRAKNELYMKRGVNPLAMMGSCWMVFVQMPIFMGLYYALQESIFFRLARFLWIQNLAAPDMLVWWGENIPIISRPEDQVGMFSMLYLGPYFNVLPIIAVCFMILQQKLLTPPPTDEQQAMQQKTMKYVMIFFGLMFYKVASGLCLYFITSSLWGLAERKLFLPKTLAGQKLPPARGKGDTGGSPARLKPRDPKPNGNGAFKKVRDMWEEILKEARKK